MTRYHVLFSDELAAAPDFEMLEGLRLIKPLAPGRDGWSRWWLMEDENAPPELEQHRVELVFTRHDDGRVTVTERHIIDENGRRVREQP